MVEESWQPRRGLRVQSDELMRLENEFDIDLLDTEQIDLAHCAGAFAALADTQQTSLRKTLEDRYDEETVDGVFGLLRRWKEEPYDERVAQTYERFVKTALRVPASVRHGGDGALNPEQRHISILQDLYRVTQCFLEANYGRHIHLYRGIRNRTVASLVAQTIAEPDAGRYYLKYSVVSNHTGDREVAHYHATDIVVQWQTRREQVLVAADHLSETPVPEDEFQVAGGYVRVEPGGILHDGYYSGDSRKLQTTVRRIEDAEDMTDHEHLDVVRLVRRMDACDIDVSAPEGGDRLEYWLDCFEERGVCSPLYTELVADAVHDIIPEDPDRGPAPPRGPD